MSSDCTSRGTGLHIPELLQSNQAGIEPAKSTPVLNLELTLTIEKKLLGLDFLVYSSHKTATQTIVASLNHSGLRSRHCHEMANINLKYNEFTSYLHMYELQNARNLSIISVFRDPMERLISSFFQWHGTRPVNQGVAGGEASTLVLKKSISELHKIFIAEYCENARGPTFESLDHLCEQLSISCNDLKFSEGPGIGVNQLETCNLYLFRFDLLIQDFSGLLSAVAGKKIKLMERNIGSAKFYAKQYRQFKETLRVPVSTIEQIYEDRKCLLNVFYPDGYRRALNKVLYRFGI